MGQFVLVVYVPESHLEILKAALFNAGCGKMGKYSHCCWQVLGQGQFKPEADSNPTIGEVSQLTHVGEYRVECVLDSADFKSVKSALLIAHPYEVPAYHFYEVIV